MSTGYYDTSYPPSLWGGGVIPATSANAGTPGDWDPDGCQPPASLADLQGGIPVAVTAVPSTPWTVGQYVRTRTFGAAGEACWTGTGWVGGRGPTQDPEPTGPVATPGKPYSESQAPGSTETAQEAPQATQDGAD